MPITHGRSDAISACQLGPHDTGLAQLGGACIVHPVYGESVLGEIDANVQNAHAFPFRIVDEKPHFPSWH